MRDRAVKLELMSAILQLGDDQSLSDLRVFLHRAEKSTDAVVRLRAEDNVLRASVCTFSPFGLLDASPTILGMRTFAELSGTRLDTLLSIRGLLDRIARLAPDETIVPIPPIRETAAWAGVDAPRGDWAFVSELPVALLTGAALAGIAEVADALPENPGELIVREVRQQVWGRPIADGGQLTAATAFTAHMLGFLASHDVVRVFSSGRWMRISTPSGHVLVYQR